MTENPLDKLQTDPRPMPDFGGELKPSGSPVGKISLRERLIAICEPKFWYGFSLLMVFVGGALDYMHANIGAFEVKYGAWAASGISGLRALSVAYQATQAVKRVDTRQVEIK